MEVTGILPKSFHGGNKRGFPPLRRFRMKPDNTPAFAIILTAALMALGPLPLEAQLSRAEVSVRAGISTSHDNYQSNCEDSSIPLSLDVQGRGRVFPQFSLDHFVGSGGGDILCIPVDPALGTTTGGLRVEGATRLGLGFGGRLNRGPFQVEGVLRGGVITGRSGYRASGSDDERRVLPHAGGQVSLVLFRWAVLSTSAHWTRLTLETTSAGAAKSSSTSWSPLITWQAGVRFPR